MAEPSATRSRHPRRWLAPAAALALAPKCLLCLAAYAGAAAGLGTGSRELCGAAPAAAFGPAVWLGGAGTLVLGGGWLAVRRRRKI